MLLTEMHLLMSSVLSEAKQYQRAGQQEMNLMKNKSWVKFPALAWVRAAFHTLVEGAASHPIPMLPAPFSTRQEELLLRTGKQEGQSEQCLKWDRGSNIQVRFAIIEPHLFSSHWFSALWHEQAYRKELPA